MSGGEAALVLGVISSCIAIIDASKKLLDAAQDEKGLPKAFRAVDSQLPLIIETLRNIQLKSREASDNECAPVAQAVKSCKENAEALQEVLQAVITDDKDGRATRYLKHIKAVGKGHKVEALAQQILGQLQHLQANHVFAKVVTKDDLQTAISQLENVDDEDGTYNSYGSGSINVAKDNSTQQNYNFSGNFKSENMHFGPGFYGEPRSPTTERCLQSLAFPGHRRRQDINAKTDGTCGWVLGHGQYRKWIENGGTLLILGRPGTGKSTLLDSMLEADLTQEPPSESETFVASFFFHRRGDPLQYSSLGLFRSLLHQFLSWDEELLAHFAADTKFEERCKNEGEPGTKWDWTESDLRNRVKECTRKFLRDRYLRLYIDALDESGERNARDIWRYLKELLGQNIRRLSICISCRPYPDVVFNPDHAIAVERENQQDIATHLRVTFRAEERWHSRADLEEIEYALKDRASGVFQWIVLVVQRVLPMRRESKAFILTEIGKVPTELSMLYEDMLRSLVKENREDGIRALRILRWITYAVRPLDLAELRYAIATDPCIPLESIQLCEKSAHWCDHDDIMADRVRRLSRGLANVLEDEKGSQTVQFDHESVKEYMSKAGILLLEKETDQNIELENAYGRAHYILCRACIQPLAIPEALARQVAVPFDSYAANHWMTHAKIVEDQGLDLANLIMDLTQWPSNRIWTEWWCWKEYGEDFGFECMTLQHVASMYGLDSVMEELIRRCTGKDLERPRKLSQGLEWRADDLDAVDDDGRTPLTWAAYNGHERVVKALLATTKVDVNSKDKYGWTPLHWAAYNGHERVVKALLATEQIDPNSKDDTGWTPLYRAASKGYEGVVKALLATGKVDVNSEDFRGWTPLDLAVSIGHEGIVKTLLATGKVDVNLKDSLGLTPLHRAASNRHEGVVKALLAMGKVEVDSKNKDGETPLHWAVYFGRAEVIKILLATGNADIHSKDKYGNTPLTRAVKEGNEEIVKLLRQYA